MLAGSTIAMGADVIDADVIDADVIDADVIDATAQPVASHGQTDVLPEPVVVAEPPWDSPTLASELVIDDGSIEEPVPHEDPLAAADAKQDGLSLIPEPNTLLMLALAALTVFLWRRKW